MNDLLSKLMQSKGQSDDMSDDYKNSKMAVLQQLRDEMTKMMASDPEGMGSLKKVTVAAPDSAGLQEGLHQAQSLMGKGVNLDDDSNPATEGDAAPVMADHEHEAEDETMEPAEGSGMEHSSDDDLDAMSPEEMKALLKQLMAAKSS